MNCHWIDRCKTYHAVERQHGVDHLTANPDFQGNNPSIHILVKNQANTIENGADCEVNKETHENASTVSPNIVNDIHVWFFHVWFVGPLFKGAYLKCLLLLKVLMGNL